MKLLRTGELANKAGVTVRSLHHYDQVGLLRPTSVSESGQRGYTQKDVERLQQIISLKSLGLSLEDIGRCLDGEAQTLQKTLTLHAAALSANIENLIRVQSSLRLMLDKLNSKQNLKAQELLAFIKEVQNMNQFYTPEQLEKLKDRYARYPEGVQAVEKAWPELFKKFEAALNEKLPVKDLKVQVLAAEAQHYIDLFTGGDQAIEDNLDKAYAQNKENALKMWNVSGEVFEYADLARKHLKKFRNG